jgi:hypothetical protein
MVASLILGRNRDSDRLNRNIELSNQSLKRDAA